MTDEQNQVPAPDPLEEEIGELLAEAEALTSELSEEIGEEPSGDFEDPDYFGDETNVEFSTEVRMQEAEHALNEATEELGGEKKKTPGKGLTLPPASSISLPKKSDAGKSKDTGKSKDIGKPNDAGKPKAGNAVSLPKASSSTAKIESLVAAKTTEPAIEVLESAKSRRAAELNKKIAVLGERLEPVSRALCAVLETIDRPFTRIQFRLRVVLGWLALAFFVAAISLWLFAI